MSKSPKMTQMVMVKSGAPGVSTHLPVGFLSPILTEASEDGKPVNGNNKICVPCHVAAMSRGRGARGAARQRVE